MYQLSYDNYPFCLLDKLLKYWYQKSQSNAEPKNAKIMKIWRSWQAMKLSENQQKQKDQCSCFCYFVHKALLGFSIALYLFLLSQGASQEGSVNGLLGSNIQVCVPTTKQLPCFWILLHYLTSDGECSYIWNKRRSTMPPRGATSILPTALILFQKY